VAGSTEGNLNPLSLKNEVGLLPLLPGTFC